MRDDSKEEQVLIENAKRDPGHFEALYNKYYEHILKFTYKRLNTPDEAYEITANTFVKALSNIHKYTYQGFPFSSWLYRIAINEINEFYRHTHKKRTVNIDDTIARYIAEETKQEQEELKQSLKAALQYLDAEELQLLELRFFDERMFSEVAEILGITENNAKVKTYRIIDKLKGIFSKMS